MVNIVGNILSPALLNQLIVLKKTAQVIDDVQLKLASGKKVNSALDNPDNFFTARRLSNKANDYNLLLDGVGQSIRALEETSIGLSATADLIDQAEAIVQTTKDYLIRGETDPAVFEVGVDTSPPSLSTQILNEAPDVYFRLNETAGPIVDSGSGALGPVSANYNGGPIPNSEPLYPNGSAASVQFDGNNDRIRVSDSDMINTQAFTRRTVELVFNAEDIFSRQVLFEEGAGVNGLTIYIDGGNVYVTAEDDTGANRFADININAPIVVGQTYHVAFVLDAPGNTFSGYLDGNLMGTVGLAGDATFPSHSGDIGIGGMNGSVQWHDGESGGNNGFNFDGRISDVAIHNKALDQTTLESHANSLQTSSSSSFFNRDYENVLDQIDQIANDANYRGINLLLGETLRAVFNPQGTSFLEVEGQDFDVDGLGLKRVNFNNLNDVEDILSSLGEARQTVRSFLRTLGADIAVLQIRTDFSEQTININLAGSDDLVVADQNQNGAELLAARTRQDLGITALSLAASSQNSILRLF